MNLISKDENFSSLQDWTELPNNIIVNLFSILTNRDRCNLSSVCRKWRSLGASPCLWQSLDLRSHNFDILTANSLSNRCGSLKKLYFKDQESEEVIISLKAKNLVEINCKSIGEDYSDITLPIMVAKHEMLEIIELGPECHKNVNSEGIEALGLCCPNLKKLWLYKVKGIYSEGINSLANNCLQLIDVAFMGCSWVDFEALTNLVSVRYLSLAGTNSLEFDKNIEQLIKFSNLIALDVSRTKIKSDGISKLLSCSFALKVLCAIKCSALEKDTSFNSSNVMGIELISMLTRVPVSLSSLALNHDNNVMAWIEQVLSHSLINLIGSQPHYVGNFWCNQGAHLVANLLKSSQNDVQEKAIEVIADILIIDEEDETLNIGLANAIIDECGISFLLNLRKSTNDEVQIYLAKVVFILCWENTISNVIGKERGIQVFLNMVKSSNIIVAEEATRALKSLSLMDAHKIIIFECGGINVLISLLYRWSTSSQMSKRVLKNVAGTFANMASNEKISSEIIKSGGLNALSILTQECMSEGVLNKAVLAFANLAGIGYSNCENIEVGLEHDLFQRLEQLIKSPLDNARQGAAIALWNLSSDENIRGTIKMHDLIEALWDKDSRWI